MQQSDKFNLNLNSGHAFEQQLIDWTKHTHPNCWYRQEPGNFKPYDLVCTHCQITVECKSDRQQSRTKNFCFELGLLKESQADWLAYKVWDWHGKVDDDTERGWHNDYRPTPYFWLFDLSKLVAWSRLYYKENPEAWKIGGDGKRNQMLVVPISRVKQLDFARCVSLETSNKPLLMGLYGQRRAGFITQAPA